MNFDIKYWETSSEAMRLSADYRGNPAFPCFLNLFPERGKAPGLIFTYNHTAHGAARPCAAHVGSPEKPLATLLCSGQTITFFIAVQNDCNRFLDKCLQSIDINKLSDSHTINPYK